MMNRLTPVSDLLRFGFTPGQLPLSDRFGRPFRYLRISVTDLCNLRCVYCMPEEGVARLPSDRILSFEEIATLTEAAVTAGVRKVRLTGGEPLVRRSLPTLVRGLARIPGIEDLSLTTNGIRLAACAEALKEAGLQRVNVSLDTLDPERFRAITRGGRMDDVLAGIAAAESVGLGPVKVNCVVMGGLNETEAPDLASLSLHRPLEIRFIEFMPMLESKECVGTVGGFEFVSNAITRSRIEARFGPLSPVTSRGPADSPAELFRIPGAAGRIGFISAMSAPFCRRCDRLRLTATGELRSCLLEGGSVDVRAILRGGGGRGEIVAAMQEALWLKPEAHGAAEQVRDAAMSRIGG